MDPLARKALDPNRERREAAARDKKLQEAHDDDRVTSRASGLASISARGPQAEQDVIEIFRKAGVKPPDFSKHRANVVRRNKPK